MTGKIKCLKFKKNHGSLIYDLSPYGLAARTRIPDLLNSLGLIAI